MATVHYPDHDHHPNPHANHFDALMTILLQPDDPELSGELDFDEFLCMLSKPPWVFMLPPDDNNDRAAVVLGSVRIV